MAGHLLKPAHRVASICELGPESRYQSVGSSISLVLLNPAFGIDEEPRIQTEIGLDKRHDGVDVLKRLVGSSCPLKRGGFEISDTGISGIRAGRHNRRDEVHEEAET